MDFRQDYERGRRYRDEGDFQVTDRRGRDRRDYERGRSDEPGLMLNPCPDVSSAAPTILVSAVSG